MTEREKARGRSPRERETVVREKEEMVGVVTETGIRVVTNILCCDLIANLHVSRCDTR